MAKRKRRRRRRAGFTARLEAGGHAALRAAWSLSIRLVVAPLARATAEASLWFRDQPRRVQVGLAAVAAAACLLAIHYVRRGPLGADALYIDDDTEALARVIHSEIGAGTRQQRLHVAWATRNLAAERGQSIAEMACSPCGPQEGGRPVSSRQAATDADRALARAVLAAPPILDPTGGASHFINPRLQDQLARSRRPGYRNRPYARVRQIWIERYHWRPYYRLGPDLELWGRARR